VWATGIGSWPTTGELDIMEGLSGDACWHFHSDAGGPGGCADMATPAGWHTFAADWRAGHVTFSYDGKQVGELTSNITAAPMFLVLNLGVSTEHGGPLSMPSEMLVDYIRVTT
jgi:beta-glucanase (GH16 family)